MRSPFFALLGLSLFAALMPAQTPITAPPTECDRLGAHPQDPERVAPGVDWETLTAQASQAVAACQQAVSQNPNTARFRFQLAMALWVAGKREESLAEMSKAVDAGHQFAAAWLGSRHFDGSLGKVDFTEAARLFRIAAEKGFAPGQSLLAQAYREGRGVPLDRAEEIKWLRRAAEQGDVYGLSTLAQNYLDGTGVGKDPAEAAKLLQRAAEKGDAAAQRNLGNLYLDGIGVPLNVQTAIQWLEKAAWQGDEVAQVNLGGLYFEGLLVARDDPQATKWLLMVAAGAKMRADIVDMTTPAEVLARDILCTMLGDKRVGSGDAAAAAKICKGWNKATSLLAQQAKPEGISSAGSQPQSDTEPGSVPIPPFPPPTPPLPNLKFSVKDPCATSQWQQPGALWQPVAGTAPSRTPSSALPVVKTPVLDFKSLSEAQYAGAVSTAKEGLRVLYGPMEKEDEARFEAIWAPIYDHPSPEVVDYFNRLNPLLGQFLAGRVAMTSAVGDFQQALGDAAIAKSFGNDQVLLDDLADGDRAKDEVLALEAGMAEVAAKIQALGNPPNALEEKCKAASRHARAVAAPDTTPFDTVMVHGAFSSDRGNGDMKLLAVDVSVSTLSGGQVAADDTAAVGDVSTEGVCEADEPNPSRICSRKHQVVISFGPDQKSVKEVRAWGVSSSTLDGRPVGMRIWDDLTAIDLPLIHSEMHTSWGVQLYGVRGTDALKHLRHYQGSIVLAGSSTPQDDLWVALTYGNRDDMPEEIGELMKHDGMLARLSAEIPLVAGLGGTSTSNNTAAPLALPDPPERPNLTGQNTKAEEEALQESILLSKANIQIIEGNLRAILNDIEEEKKRQPADDRETKDKTKRLEQLEWLAVNAKSDIQRENDLIASYETGTLVHTRSAFDEYAHANFVQTLQREAERFNSTSKIKGSVEKLIALLPADAQQDVRAKANELIDPKTVAAGDVEKARAAAEVIGTMVQGYWQQQAAANRAKVDEQDQAVLGAAKEVVKLAAVGAFIGAAPGALAWKFGGEAAAYWWAPNAAGALYGGVTGAIHGGPGGAVQEGLAWAGMTTAMMVEFYKGWNEKDKDGKPLGLAGAAPRVLLMGAVMVGAHAFGKAMSSSPGAAKPAAEVVEGKLSGAAKPTWAEVVDMKLYDQELADAKSLVNRYRETGQSLAKAVELNPAGADVLRLEKEVQALTASLNSSYHSKWVLKYESDKFTQKLFTDHVDELYAKVHPEFLKRMKESMGYDMKDIHFKPFRNASSKATVNMDHDLGLIEWDAWTGTDMAILKKGRQVSKAELVEDAQKAYDAVYHDLTGFSGKRSQIELTWRGHKEAFLDLELLNKVPDWTKVRNMPQAATVTLGKAQKFIGDEARNFIGAEPMSMIARQQEACRTAAKDLETKVLPYLEAKVAQARAAKNATDISRLTEIQAYWKEVTPQLARIGRQETDPFKIWQGLQDLRGLRQTTGGRSIPQLLKDLRFHLASIRTN